jgi:prolyl-tRNA editing enzyme YbaK/EbsC (Cys-tRNA(Pro) deacylase)
MRLPQSGMGNYYGGMSTDVESGAVGSDRGETAPLGPAHVRRVLAELDPSIAVRTFDAGTFTSQDAANAIGCELGQIAKSICLFVAGDPILVVMSGDKRVSDAKLAKRYGIGRKKVKIAKPEECVRVFGYEPGGVAPVGHRTSGIPVLIDRSLAQWDTVWTAAGSASHNFPVTFQQLTAITGGEVVDLAQE